MRRWLIHGLYVLYQYWLTFCSRVVWSLMMLSQNMKPDYETQWFVIYICMSMMCCRLRPCSHAKLHLIIDDSG